MRGDGMVVCDAMRCDALRVRAVGSWGLLYRGLDLWRPGRDGRGGQGVLDGGRTNEGAGAGLV
jgi:hypothetical protein